MLNQNFWLYWNKAKYLSILSSDHPACYIDMKYVFYDCISPISFFTTTAFISFSCVCYLFIVMICPIAWTACSPSRNIFPKFNALHHDSHGFVLPDVLLCSFSFLLFYISRSAFCFRHTLCYIIYLFAFILNVYVLSLRKAVLCLVTGKLDAFSPLGPLGPRETARYNRHFSVRQTCGLCSFRTNKRKIQPS